MNSLFRLVAEYAKDFLHAFGQLLISVDQLANNLISMFFPGAWKGSWADETLSCRSYRMWVKGKVAGKISMPIIDFLFAWQKQDEGVIGHCHGAYLKESARYNLPPEMRKNK